MIDSKKIEKCIKEILIALGENPEREGLIDTPKRVAKMYEEVFCGIQYSNDEIAEMFGTTFDEDDYLTESFKNIILVKDIAINSYCEHHLALMYNMKASVFYIPKEKVIGLSKIARIADMVSRRLQLQERIGSDICSVIQKATDSEDVGVVITGEHSCMTSRGIKKHGSLTTTATFCGKFLHDDGLRQEALLLLQQRGGYND